MEEKQIYREKSLERISSPDNLYEYLGVVHPAGWILLSAIAAFLVGALIWCAFIKLETRSVTAAAVVKNGQMSLYMTEDGKNDVKEDMILTVDDHEFILPSLDMSGAKLYKQNDAAILDILGTTDENFVYVAKLNVDMPNGVYSANIATEQVSPLTLIFN